MADKANHHEFYCSEGCEIPCRACRDMRLPQAEFFTNKLHKEKESEGA